MNIQIIKVGDLETNCYLIINDNTCIIIDPGDEPDKIIFNIEKFNLNPVAIFVTHYHFDHIGALESIRKKYNTKVYDYNNYNDDNELLNIINLNFKIISTTGHKEDSVTYYFPDYNVMFVGDFVFKGDIGRCDLAGGNFKEMLQSIKKIKSFPTNTILYPGHGEKTILKNEIKYNKYFK